MADLANKTIEENRHLFSDSDVKVLAQLSTQVKPGPSAATGEPKAFDLLVTETFGTLLLGESALAFVSDASHWILFSDVFRRFQMFSALLSLLFVIPE